VSYVLLKRIEGSAAVRPRSKPARPGATDREALARLDAGRHERAPRGESGVPESRFESEIPVRPISRRTNLVIGAPDDPLEHHADHAAARVVSYIEREGFGGSDPHGVHGADGGLSRGSGSTDGEAVLRRQCEACEREDEHATIRRATAVDAARSAPQAAHPAFAARLQQERANGGRGLEPALRGRMEHGFASDFSAVKIHDNARSAGLVRQARARAFTVGHDVYFGHGEYRPQTRGGTLLLAHELAHVVQQDASVLRRTIDVTMRTPDDLGLALIEPRIRMDDDRDLVLVRQHLSGFLGRNSPALPKGTRKQMIGELLAELRAAPTTYYFASYRELADEILSRVVIAMLMKYSQGSKTSGFEYPDRSATRGHGPRANAAAAAYWGKVQDYGGAGTEEYRIPLSKKGRDDPSTAIELLFTPQSDPKARTLIHCDHLISLIHLYVLMQKVGRERFNGFVAAGSLAVEIYRAGNQDIWVPPTATNFDNPRVRRHNAVSGIVVKSEKEFLTGDHIVFYNHPSYPTLNQATQAPWKLENAIVTKGSLGEVLYQGHGFRTPISRDAMIGAMVKYYNKLVDKVEKLVKARQFARLAKEFPALYLDETSDEGAAGNSTDPSAWSFQFQPEGCTDVPKRTKRLKILSSADFTKPFTNPCTDQIEVNRPLESVANNPTIKHDQGEGKVR